MSPLWFAVLLGLAFGLHMAVRFADLVGNNCSRFRDEPLNVRIGVFLIPLMSIAFSVGMMLFIGGSL